MNRALTALLLTTALAVLGACASGSSSSSSGTSTATENKTAAEPAKPAAEAKTADVPPPAGHPFAKVTVGMSDAEVRKVLGEPDNANAYMTGKQFIPFYFGPDQSRTDWMYKGKGRIVFSRNQYSGGLKVIRVMYNPSEP
jgi:ABC-type Fe3+-hydroxamate transport system substrate-binding protein